MGMAFETCREIVAPVFRGDTGPEGHSSILRDLEIG
jgi:hypothetical protein